MATDHCSKCGAETNVTHSGGEARVPADARLCSNCYSVADRTARAVREAREQAEIAAAVQAAQKGATA